MAPSMSSMLLAIFFISSAISALALATSVIFADAPATSPAIFPISTPESFNPSVTSRMMFSTRAVRVPRFTW